MVCAGRYPRYGWFPARSKKHARKLTCPIKQGDVLRERNRNSTERRDSLVNAGTGFQDVAQQQNHRKSEPLSATAAVGQAGDQSLLVHPVETTAPWTLGFVDPAMSRPRRQL